MDLDNVGDGMPSPLAILKGIETAASAFKGDGSTKVGKRQVKLNRRKQEFDETLAFISLIQKAMDRGQQNAEKKALLEATVPAGRHFAKQGLSLSMQSSALSRGTGLGSTRTYADEAGTGASLTPGGETASPDELSSLTLPPPEVFDRAAEQALSGFTAENLFTPGESALDVVDFEKKAGFKDTGLEIDKDALASVREQLGQGG